MIGETVGSYRIVSRLGVGGMGAVYRAEHQLLGRAVAVKLLLPELTANRDITQRFFNEARATTAIKHPGIVEVFDFGYLPSGHAYIVMELLDGEPLTQRIRARGRMPEGEACALLRDVCSALAAAHDKGIVHRDLKPDNIFIVPDLEHGERIKILDFGIAKLTDIGLAGSATKTGAVMGTPTYMSPEQCKGSGAVDHRADLYSIGCMLYELVAGRPPFVRDGAGELIGSHLFVEPEPPSRHVAISPELDALIMTLLAKEPAQRVQTARELSQRLLQIAQGHGYAGDVRMSGVDLARNPSFASLPAHRTPAHYTPAHYTPAHHTPAHHTPAHHTPAHYTPAHQAATQHAPAHYTPAHRTPPPHDAPAHLTPAPAPAPATAPAHGQPTTLSGAASQTLPPPASSKRRLGIVLASVAIAAAAGIGIVVTTSGGSTGKARDVTPVRELATQPAATQSVDRKPVDGKPTDGKPTDSKPTDTKSTDTRPADTKPADTEPAATPSVDSKPVDSKPVDSKPTDSKPVDSKPTDPKPTDTTPADTKPTDSASTDAKPADTKPTDTTPADTKPADTTPTRTKPTDTKPMTSKPSKPSRPSRPTKPKSDKPSGDLLETDL